MSAWTPSSWQQYERVQMAVYDDKEATKKALDKLSTLPPLINPNEADRLQTLLAEAGQGKRFIVQGGDCAERFMDCNGERLEAQVKMMLQLGMIIEQVTGTPALTICRIAGQYGKPRSKPTETVEGYGEIMSFKGENINGFDPADRKWDPDRLVQGYFHSAATLNFLRHFLKFSDAKAMASIDMNTLKASPEYEKYKDVAQDIACKSHEHEIFTAHEAMQLDLEEALTRKVGSKYYNLSSHLVWIGDRTRQIPGAHVEYFRGLSNPLGCKVGPTMSEEEIKDLVKYLNPDGKEGKLIIITRYGAGKVAQYLPKHIQAVKETGIPVVWQCDAVHGNGIVGPKTKVKTRHFDDILKEVFECMQVHKDNGSVLGGIHLECTGQPTVTECLGGCIGMDEDMLGTNYETWCDPRLNYSQAVEAAFKVADAMKA